MLWGSFWDPCGSHTLWWRRPSIDDGRRPFIPAAVETPLSAKLHRLSAVTLIPRPPEETTMSKTSKYLLSLSLAALLTGLAGCDKEDTSPEEGTTAGQEQ